MPGATKPEPLVDTVSRKATDAIRQCICPGEQEVCTGKTRGPVKTLCVALFHDTGERKW